MQVYYKVFLDFNCTLVCVSEELSTLAEACSHYKLVSDQTSMAGYVTQYVKYSGISKDIYTYTHDEIMYIFNNTALTDQLGYYVLINKKEGVISTHYQYFWDAYSVLHDLHCDDITIGRYINKRLYTYSKDRLPDTGWIHDGTLGDVITELVSDIAALLKHTDEEFHEFKRKYAATPVEIKKVEAIIETATDHLLGVDAYFDFLAKEE